MFLNIGYSNEWWHVKHGISFDGGLYVILCANLPLSTAWTNYCVKGLQSGAFWGTWTTQVSCHAPRWTLSRMDIVSSRQCLVAMLSPRIYQEFCYPYDLRIMDHAKQCGVSFSIHQDSCIDSFLPVYKDAFDSLSSFDIGCDSNVRVFREAFPDLTINVFIYTSVLRSMTAGQLFDLILRLAEEGQPYLQIGFSVYDIDIQVSDEKRENRESL